MRQNGDVEEVTNIFPFQCEYIFSVMKFTVNNEETMYVCIYVCMNVCVCKYMKIIIFGDMSPNILAE
jgi:hypothetical protein